MSRLDHFSLHTYSRRLQEVLWLAAAAGVPLAFNPWGQNGFELPKALLLRTLVLLLGLAALVEGLESHAGGRRRRLRLPLFYPALAYGLVFIAATLLAVNPRLGLWGLYERQQGLLAQLAYVALFLLTARGLRTREQRVRLWNVLVWGSAPVVAYGLVQALGWDVFEWRTDAASPVLSTLGRANFLGSYLVLVIPLTAGRLLMARRRWSYAFLLMAQVACLALTQARGAYVGLGVTAVVGLLAWSLARGDRRPAWAALSLVVLAVAFVVLLNVPNGPLAPLTCLPGLDRLARLTHTDSGSTAARITIWRATLPLVAARPVLGYGPEGMRAAFARIFPPQLVYYEGRHVVDRAHNLWLDLGMSAGLAGILAFTALMAGFGRLAWRGLRTASEHRERVAWVALAATVTGTLADLQFSFGLTASTTVLWLVLALASAMSREPATTASAEERPGTSSLLLYLPLAAVVLVLVGLVCLRPLLADGAGWQALQHSPLPARRAAAQRAVRLWPLEPEYRLLLAEVLQEGGEFAAAETQLAMAVHLSPGDPWLRAAQGTLYARWARQEPARLLQSEAAYRESLALAPNLAPTHAALGAVLARQGRLEEGCVELERAVALDASNKLAYHHLVELYRMLGREENP